MEVASATVAQYRSYATTAATEGSSISSGAIASAEASSVGLGALVCSSAVVDSDEHAETVASTPMTRAVIS